MDKELNLSMALDPTICFLGIGQEPHQLSLVKPGNQLKKMFVYSQETMGGELFTIIAYEWISGGFFTIRRPWEESCSLV